MERVAAILPMLHARAARLNAELRRVDSQANAELRRVDSQRNAELRRVDSQANAELRRIDSQTTHIITDEEAMQTLQQEVLANVDHWMGTLTRMPDAPPTMTVIVPGIMLETVYHKDQFVMTGHTVPIRQCVGNMIGDFRMPSQLRGHLPATITFIIRELGIHTTIMMNYF